MAGTASNNTSTNAAAIPTVGLDVVRFFSFANPVTGTAPAPAVADSAAASAIPLEPAPTRAIPRVDPIRAALAAIPAHLRQSSRCP